MSIFDKFDNQVNMDDIKKQMAEASENSFEEVPAGEYITKIEKMELGTTKDGRPMFRVQMRIVDSEGVNEQQFLSKYKKKKPCLFMNRVIFGTKNDGNMIASVVGWLNRIGFEPLVEFRGYADFQQVVMDCAEHVGSLEFAVTYDPAKFNAITINEVYSV